MPEFSSDTAMAWRASPHRMSTLVERSPDLVLVLAADLTVLYASHAAQRMLGQSPAQLEHSKLDPLVDPRDLDRLHSACADAADGILGRPVALHLRRRDGLWLTAEALVRYDADERCLIATVRDVGERRRAELRLRREVDRQRLVVALGEQALMGADLAELIGSAVRELAGALLADYVAVLRSEPDCGTLVLACTHGDTAYSSALPTAAGATTQPAVALHSAEPVIVRDWAAERRFEEAPALVARGFASAIAVAIPGARHPFGAIVAQSGAPGAFTHEDGVLVRGVANVLAGAYARADGEERIRYQALHDKSTALPNRALFEDRLTRALTSAQRHSRRVAVLSLGLDSFKLVSESLGHASADQLLGAFADRVADCLRAEDTVARVGADVFGVLLPELAAETDVLRVVERINHNLRVPLRVGDRGIVTSASIGIAFNQDGGQRDEAGALMRDADLAMYAAQARGPGSWEFFAPHMHDAAVRQLELTSDLHRAVQRGEFEVHFQPIVSLTDEAIVGAEALVRWQHPEHGLLGPGAFMPIAEDTGMIVPIGRFVLRTAAHALAAWQAAATTHRALSVSVNLGLQQVCAADLLDDVRSVLAQTGIDPSSLVLEITEDVLLTRDGVLDRLRELRALGVRLAVDDFGTGYSALSHLQRFPVDVIKIDKSFVDGIAEDADRARLIRGIIELTHSLGLVTVAEGIESGEQADVLRELGSELGQGFHYARPQPANAVAALLASGRRTPSHSALEVNLGLHA